MTSVDVLNILKDNIIGVKEDSEEAASKGLLGPPLTAPLTPTHSLCEHDSQHSRWQSSCLTGNDFILEEVIGDWRYGCESLARGLAERHLRERARTAEARKRSPVGRDARDSRGADREDLERVDHGSQVGETAGVFGGDVEPGSGYGGWKRRVWRSETWDGMSFDLAQRLLGLVWTRKANKEKRLNQPLRVPSRRAGLRVQGLRFRVEGLGFRDRVQGLRFEVQGSCFGGFRFQV